MTAIGRSNDSTMKFDRRRSAAAVSSPRSTTALPEPDCGKDRAQIRASVAPQTNKIAGSMGMSTSLS